MIAARKFVCAIAGVWPAKTGREVEYLPREEMDALPFVDDYASMPIFNLFDLCPPGPRNLHANSEFFLRPLGPSLAFLYVFQPWDVIAVFITPL